MRKEFIVKSGDYVTHAMEYHNEEEYKKAVELHKKDLEGKQICCRQCDKETPLEKLGTLEDDDYGICDECAGRMTK
jgi:hypothetical protein